uniref:Uncharacterized protein n=1 Tax=Anopheles coluzzii TaxID=1518534 RepID=A0A8W7PVK0_ANOCL
MNGNCDASGETRQATLPYDTEFGEGERKIHKPMVALIDDPVEVNSNVSPVPCGSEVSWTGPYGLPQGRAYRRRVSQCLFVAWFGQELGCVPGKGGRIFVAQWRHKRPVVARKGPRVNGGDPYGLRARERGGKRGCCCWILGQIFRIAGIGTKLDTSSSSSSNCKRMILIGTFSPLGQEL